MKVFVVQIVEKYEGILETEIFSTYNKAKIYADNYDLEYQSTSVIIYKVEINHPEKEWNETDYYKTGKK